MKTPSFQTTCIFVIFIILYVCLYYLLINDTIQNQAYESLTGLDKRHDRRPKQYPQLSIVVYNSPSYLNFETKNHIFSQCPFSNCRLTYSRSNLRDQSAILFCLTESPALPPAPPLSPSERNSNQVWMFFWLEAPARHKFYGLSYRNEKWRGTVNWTMSYTLDAEIHLPYGVLYKRIPPAKNYSEIFHRKTKMAAWVTSNCNTQSQRMRFVSKLREQGIEVDMFGKCAGQRVDGGEIHKIINQSYKFYLSFENSFCKDYITEKFFNYLQLDVILVTRGGGNYSKFVSNTAFVNTEDFSSVKSLANYLKTLASNETLYIKYMKEKDMYGLAGKESIEYGTYCNMCEKLNNLEKSKHIYADYRNYVDNCFEPTDLK